jgi:hypothetical protein
VLNAPTPPSGAASLNMALVTKESVLDRTRRS